MNRLEGRVESTRSREINFSVAERNDSDLNHTPPPSAHAPGSAVPHHCSTLALSPAKSSPAAARQLSARSVFNEAVRYAQMQHRQLQSLRSKKFADAGAGAADACVLLDRHDGAMTRGEARSRSSSSTGLTKRILTSVASRRSAISVRCRRARKREKRKTAASFATQLCTPTGRAVICASTGTPGPVPRGYARLRPGQSARGVQHLAAFVFIGPAP